MVKKLVATILALLLSTPVLAQESSTSLSETVSKAEISRDSYGRIRRSSSARREFMRETGYVHGRPGYVIDHIVPLACGGPDDPSNMQWQTISDAKAKDQWELIGCSAGAPGVVVQAF